MKDYMTMLEEAMKKVPESLSKKERFEIPKIRGHIQGNKTVLSNFFHIADVLGRDHNHFLKYMLKELATPGEVKKPRLILGRKISASRINEKIRAYADKYVFCRECGKPDSKLIKQNRIMFFKCNACGAKYPVN